jgi:hypothetical protein
MPAAVRMEPLMGARGCTCANQSRSAGGKSRRNKPKTVASGAKAALQHIPRAAAEFDACEELARFAPKRPDGRLHTRSNTRPVHSLFVCS